MNPTLEDWELDGLKLPYKSVIQECIGQHSQQIRKGFTLDLAKLWAFENEKLSWLDIKLLNKGIKAFKNKTKSEAEPTKPTHRFSG